MDQRKCTAGKRRMSFSLSAIFWHSQFATGLAPVVKKLNNTALTESLQSSRNKVLQYYYKSMQWYNLGNKFYGSFLEDPTTKVQCNPIHPSCAKICPHMSPGTYDSIFQNFTEGEQAYFREALIDHFWCMWIVMYWKTVLWIVIEVISMKPEQPKSSVAWFNFTLQCTQTHQQLASLGNLLVLKTLLLFLQNISSILIG